jgi:FKBP-type peptidyl-prolyl isomerase-like protein
MLKLQRIRFKVPVGRRLLAATLLAAPLGLSCGGATFPRETVADNARADDPWLEGERCAADFHDDTGLRVEVLEAGSGKVVGEGESVRVHYVARLPNGTVVHDTRKDGPPLEIMIGSAKIICGFERAMLGMRAGEQRRVFVPWRLAFGEAGKPPDVQPQTDLIFVIDLYLAADPALVGGSPPVNPVRGRGR